MRLSLSLGLEFYPLLGLGLSLGLKFWLTLVSVSVSVSNFGSLWSQSRLGLKKVGLADLCHTDSVAWMSTRHSQPDTLSFA